LIVQLNPEDCGATLARALLHLRKALNEEILSELQQPGDVNHQQMVDSSKAGLEPRWRSASEKFRPACPSYHLIL